jgi:hypothetical protein
MSSLTGNLISNTYQGLLKTSGSSAITSTLIPITDGLGNNTALSLSTETGSIDGDLIVTGVIHGIATQAVTASYAITASYLSGSITNAVSSSYAASASYAANADLLDGRNSTVFATTGSNTFIGNQIVSGSITPGGLAYDLGTIDAPWRDLYVSTGSIKFTNNGVVVSTLGVGTDGTQITGSLAISSSILLQNGSNKNTTIKARSGTGGGLLVSSTGSIYLAVTGGSTSFIGYNPETDQISNIGLGINARTVNNGAGSVTIGGPANGSRGGALSLLNTSTLSEWIIGNDASSNLTIGTVGLFVDKSILFKYKDTETDPGYNIAFSGSGIIPGETGSYDLGSIDYPWRDLYVSTGSIKFTNNGTVVSTLGADTNGTQITGSLNISGSIVVSPAGGFYKASITAYSGSSINVSGLKIASTGSQISIFSTGSTDASAIFLGIDARPASGQPRPANTSVAINTYYNEYGPGSLMIGGPKDASRGGLLGFHNYGGNTEWTISQTTDVTNNLIIEVNGYPALQQNELLFKPADLGSNTYNVKITAAGILPEPADSGNTYDLGSETAPWDNTFTNNLVLTEQSQPSSPYPGQIYFSSADSHFYGWNGTTWKQLDN